MTNSSVLDFPDLHIDIDDHEKVIEGAKDLVAKVKPEWNRQKLKNKVFSDGITNVLVGIFQEGDSKDKMVMVRLYGHNTDQMIDRGAEIRNLQMFSDADVGAKLYAKWANGLAYAFVPGVNMTKETVVDPKVNQLVIEMFVKMHKMNPARSDTCLWERLRQFIEVAPDENFDGNEIKAKRYKECGIMTKAEIRAEISELESVLKDTSSPIVFSHNDLLLANIIYNEKDQKVTFIDLEYGDANYRAFDIGNHFTEFVGVCDVMDYDKYYPDEAFQKEWLTRYLTAYNSRPPTPEELHSEYVEVNKFALCAHLQWGIWALVQAKNSSLDFDFIDYAMQRLNEYKRRKATFLALK